MQLGSYYKEIDSMMGQSGGLFQGYAHSVGVAHRRPCECPFF